MDRKSLEKLRLDRRLAGRRGWIARKDLEAELAALPDIARKMTTLGEAEDASGAGGKSAPETRKD